MKRKAEADLLSNPRKKGLKRKHAYDIHHIELPDPEYMSEVPEHLQNKNVPGFPSTIMILGKPGSGKSNLLLNLILNPVFWFGLFDKIYLLGPTIKSDKLWKKIKVPDDQIVTNPADFINKLNEWTETQMQAVEQNPNTAPKLLFVFEDFTAYHSSVQSHPDFIKCFTTIRHHKSTACANVHKYKAFNRTARLASQHLCIFPVTRTELDAIFADFGPDRLDKKDFYLLCDFAWEPTPDNEKPFLYINMYADEKKRYRKCFTEIIPIDSFAGKAKKTISDKKQSDKQEKKMSDYCKNCRAVLEKDTAPVDTEKNSQKKEEAADPLTVYSMKSNKELAYLLLNFLDKPSKYTSKSASDIL